MSSWIMVFPIAIVAGLLSGVVGTGSSLLLLPVLVYAFGPKTAVPIMAIAAIIGNLSRVIVWRHHICWRPALVYAMTGAPAAMVGAHTLLVLPGSVVDAALGLFFWGLLPLRALLQNRQWRLSLVQVSLCGGLIGFLTGLVVSTGPLSVPVFMAYGLQGGAFLGSEATSALLLYSSKIATFASMGALPTITLLQGGLVGAGIMIGTVIGKPLVLNLSPKASARLIDLILAFSGSALLINAWHGH